MEYASGEVPNLALLETELAAHREQLTYLWSNVGAASTIFIASLITMNQVLPDRGNEWTTTQGVVGVASALAACAAAAVGLSQRESLESKNQEIADTKRMISKL